MKNLFKTIAVLSTALVLAACGRVVEVPPAHIGKVMTKDGYQSGIINPSKLRLPACFAYCDKLVITDVSDKSSKEFLKIFIPADKLELEVDVQITLSLNKQKVESLFNTVTAKVQDGDLLIEWEAIYKTYAKQIIQTESREYLSRFSISEIASSMQKVNSDLRQVLTKAIESKTPFDVRYVGITKIKYPDIITAAQENAATRREQIQQEEAQLEISKVQLERELQEARLQRQIDLERAQGEAAAQIIQREVVDDKVLELRKLENKRLWIEKWDGKLPVTTLGESVPIVNLNK